MKSRKSINMTIGALKSRKLFWTVKIENLVILIHDTHSLVLYATSLSREEAPRLFFLYFVI